MNNSSIRKWFIHQALDHSWRTIILSILATLVMSSGIRFLVVDDDMMKMLPKDMKSKTTWDSVQNEFGSTEVIFIAFGKEGQSSLNQEALKTLWEFSEQLERLSTVDKVSNISTSTRINNVNGFLEIEDLQQEKELDDYAINEIRKYLINNLNIKKQLLSNNEDFLLTIVQPYDDVSLDKFRNEIVAVSQTILRDYQVHYGGTAYITGSVPQMIREDVQSLVKAGVLIMVVILLFNLRSIPGVLMVLMVIIFSLVSMIGFMGWAYFLTGSDQFLFALLNTSMPIICLLYTSPSPRD